MSEQNKLARSRSPDGAQEHLRERKQVWNSSCSEFIARINAFKPKLIAFKRGLNGRGDQKAGLPISNIKFPLPQEVMSYLGGVSSEFENLASIFSSLVNEANGIAQEQSTYSESRRQSGNSNQSTQVVATLEYMIEKTASSSLSRFWAHISSLFSSSEFKHQRLSMLGMAHNLFKNLVEFEDVILAKGIENVPNVFEKYLLVNNNIKTLNNSFKRLFDKMQIKNNELPSVPTSSKQAPTVSNQTKPNASEKAPASSENEDFDALKFKDDVFKMAENNLITREDASAFFELVHKFENEKDPNKKLLAQDRIKEVYKEYKKAFFSSELQKYSSNYLTRLVKEYSHRIGKKHPTSGIRLEVYNYIREAKKLTDKLMDLLENKDLEFENLLKTLNKLEILIIKINDPIKILNNLYQDKYYDGSKSMKEPNIDAANRHFMRQVRRNVDKY